MTSLDAFKIIMERIGKGESLEGTYNEFLLIKKDLEIFEVMKKDINELAKEKIELEKKLAFSNKKFKCEEYHHNEDKEILEILRDKAKHLYDENKENEYIIIELNDEILNNDFEIVKEWLERKE